MNGNPSSSSATETNAADLEKEPNQDAPPRLEVFSVFTVNQKRAMVATGSMASFFSPLSSSIYFPAMDTIATALNVSTSKIDLTVTTYLIMQGIAPMLIAGFSDTAGRRPAYIICFTVYIAANLGLGIQNDYGSLLGLRCLQRYWGPGERGRGVEKKRTFEKWHSRKKGCIGDGKDEPKVSGNMWI
ncbi:hypothetical protein ASPNIDRAFT_46137 [Aspergillus niger ATCC 1015]|uniref:Major facilitator superfamily (MFS) profile domain-containing protein n=1 Tax=Aspergillus niger (strain ATCC 1015 / CBS 113.46 / FGSC A1144 / LSHB Ac4 / NCTC 3858a / NRRL 328 / USDA 3528.7) TaxID=380704 RepID=G3Y404_ASPNA|nr:hypothetical protein ASPNIDRAFT_46137 [Aspergillus niger ATCC 1015]